MLKHYNDGKEKYQSHEVYDDELPDLMRGYGETYEEARQEFKKNLAEYNQKIETVYNNFDSQEAINVNCIGKPV